MDFKFTAKYQHSQRLSNNKRRSLKLYFINGVLIFKQKVPFDENMEYGISKNGPKDEYLLNNNIYQKRGDRNVKYPVSKKKLEQFNIPKDLKILLSFFDVENYKKRKKLKYKLVKIRKI